MFFYFGVLVDKVYGCIAPEMDGVPEFTAGFAVWHHATHKYENYLEAWQEMQQILAGKNEGWTLRPPVQDGSSKVSILARSRPFISLYQPDLDWAAQAEDFYRRSLDEANALSAKQLATLVKMGS